jgi:hypothetical protein
MTDEKAPGVTLYCRFCGSTRLHAPSVAPLRAGEMAYCSDCGKVTPAMTPSQPELKT